jgi:uncharacterized membrane protein YidH (DUF202 family)
MAPWSRFAAPVYKNTGSVARDHLASERTYLAWTRTGLGFVALGIAIERFSRFELAESRDDRPLRPRPKDDDEQDDQLGSKILVGTLMTLGTGSMLYATKRYFSVLRLLEQGQFRPAFYGVGTLGAVLGALGVGVFAGTANGWHRERQVAREPQ